MEFHSNRLLRRLKILSKSFKWLLTLCIGGLGLAVASCAPVISTPSPIPSQSPPLQTEEPVRAPQKPSPRAIAALQLTEQARLFLESDNPDDAIRILERAINLNPTNGQNYYYLSEAWLMKGDIAQATEFNRLAAIYLEDDEWMYRLMQQRELIKKRSR